MNKMEAHSKYFVYHIDYEILEIFLNFYARILIDSL